MEKQDIRALLEKYKTGKITEEEKAILDKWYLHVIAESSEELSDIERLQTFDTVLANLKAVIYPNKERQLWTRITAAASIILCLLFGGYYLLHKQQSQQIAKTQQQDIAPGGNKATLTLSNGQKVSLSDAKNGIIAQQAGTQVQKAQNGQVVYLADSLTVHSSKALEVTYNTISTPRGGQWKLTLPDGSRVWLNAASSITFPTVFAGNERSVKITGEAYFEVIHNAAHPFIVISKDQTIEDIGTHFNINAYNDEPESATTLIEGKVRINAGGAKNLLYPGQQARVVSGHISISDTDVDQAIAWKNGDFAFQNTSLKAIMREISRWYDIEVIYTNNIQNVKLGGSISKFKNISEVLNTLESTQTVHFKLAGRRVYVMQ